MEHGRELLTESSLEQGNEVFRLEPAIMAELALAAAEVRGHDWLREVFAKIVQSLLGEPSEDAEEAGERIAAQGARILQAHAEEINRLMGARSGQFAVLLAMGLLPWTMDYYKSRRIPQPVLIDTMSDLSIWMRHYYKEHGVWGLGNFEWLSKHLGGRLFRLGRLQFAWGEFPFKAIVLGNRLNDEVLALSEGGVSYLGDGLVDGTNGRYAGEQGGWESIFTENEARYRGHPLSPSGHAIRDMVQLTKPDWREVLRRGAPVLEVHIAEGSPMTHALCRASYLEADRFVADHFPDRDFDAFVCSSWLLDSQFQRILPSESNIVKFQKDYYMIPLLSDEKETYWRVFGKAELEPDKASRDTTLRRAILEFAEGGGKLHGGGGFMLRGSIAAFGED